MSNLEQIGLEVECLEGLDAVERGVGVLSLDLNIVLVLDKAFPR